MGKTLVCTVPMKEQEQEALEKLLPGWELIYGEEETVTEEQVKSAEIIVGWVPPSFIQGSENLRLFQLHSAGADRYMVPGVLPEQTVMTNATGAYGRAVAEHGFALTWMLLKKLNLYRDAQLSCQWKDEGTVNSFFGSKVLVVGLGDIGRYYAGMCKALGAHVIGVKRRGGSCPPEVDELYLTEEIDKLLPDADIIFSVLPYTPATDGFFNGKSFSLMKDSAIFINCGRGNTVVTDDMVKALQDGEIFAAGMDVVDPEPLPAEHPLWKLPNAVVTPHVAGGFHLEHTRLRIIEIAMHNIAAYLKGEALESIVDMETGYKK